MFSKISVLLFLLLGTNNPLHKYQWENRLVLIFGDNADLEKKQLDELSSSSSGLDERDILYFLITENDDNANFNKEETQYLKDKYTTNKQTFTVVLVGKDGGIKQTIENQVLETKTLFALIDGMPMRRAEMKNKDGRE